MLINLICIAAVGFSGGVMLRVSFGLVWFLGAYIASANPEVPRGM